MKKSSLLIFFFMNYLFSSTDSHSGGSWIEDWLYPDTGLYIWSVITFLLVLAILKWKAWGPLMQTLDERERRIKDSLNKAEQIVQDHAKSAQDNEKILNKAREEAKGIVAQAKEAGDKLKVKLEEDGRHKYDELLANATKAIESERNKALNDIKKMVVEVAIEASEKIVKRNLNTDDNKRMIEETVNSFKQKN